MATELDPSAVRDLPPDAEIVIEGEKPRGTWTELQRMERKRMGTLIVRNANDYFALRAVPAAPTAGKPSK